MATQIKGGDLRAKSLISHVQTLVNNNADWAPLFKELKSFFACEGALLFWLDRRGTRQLISRNNLAEGLPSINLDVNPKHIWGYVASLGKPLNIQDISSTEEMSKHHPNLEPGSHLEGQIPWSPQAALLIPLAHQKKLVGVLGILSRRGKGVFNDDQFKTAKELSAPLGLFLTKMYDSGNGAKTAPSQDSQERILSIVNTIHSAKNVDEILIELKTILLELFEVEQITIYAVDPVKNEIYSKVKSGSSINEIRVPVAPQSIAGCVALEQRPAIIQNVYDHSQLKAYHQELTFDSSWDKKTGFKTKGMLVVPMLHQRQLMGVLQLINKEKGEKFGEVDEKNARMIGQTIALAFFNQAKFVKQKPTKFSYLTQNGIITDIELNQAIAKARRNQIDIEQILLKELKIQRKDLGKSLENFYNLPYVGFDNESVLPASLFEGLNQNFLLKNNWVPILREGNDVTILIDNPLNQDKAQNIRLIFPRKNITFKISLKADIRDYLNGAVGDPIDDEDTEAPPIEEMASLLHALQNEKDDTVETVMQDYEEMNAISETDSTIVRLVNKVLTDAFDKGVSDIHLEPGTGRDTMRVRFRRDGICRIYQEIPPIYKQAILSRIKIMAKLDIAERRLPQDGKIKMKYGRKEIEFRVATCPTVGGNEDAVLRILAASKPIPLDKMNFSQRNLELIKAMAAKPYGLILVVGPTGSGKTTTLHSALGHINTPERKIWTAEDPVEITQKGLRQVQMLPKIGLDFSRAMRSFLRGDPDVIMVGEMRDAETASIGLEASLTGHLVLSTLHTNSAPETITRLLDMGMNPLNFADALLLVSAQRLVRTLCKECKEPYHPSREEYDILVREFGDPALFKKHVGVDYTGDLKFNRTKGCDKCGDSGYSGRTGLHELLEGTEEIKRLIMTKALVEEIREQAQKDGMTTLKQDGIWKVFKGDCDLKQVLAVCIM